MAQHRMARLDHTGHTLVEWETENEETVRSAERTFEEERKSGYAPFAETENGETVQLHRFDPDADIVMVPQSVGG